MVQSLLVRRHGLFESRHFLLKFGVSACRLRERWGNQGRKAHGADKPHNELQHPVTSVRIHSSLVPPIRNSTSYVDFAKSSEFPPDQSGPRPPIRLRWL